MSRLRLSQRGRGRSRSAAARSDRSGGAPMTLGAELLGESPAMVEVRGHVERLLLACARASRPPRILIQGETGSGKGLVARLIHRFGPRAQAPFVDVNCAAVPENLIEAELFGYERGAFTDARRSKPGLFQLATRGTLFLDEVGLLSPSAQGKLLSALEQGEVRRLGSTRSEPVDVWVIAATNEDLDAARKDRRVREDFFQRLAVHTIKLPPLRAHAGDIVPLAEHFLARACADYRLPPRGLASDARELLTAYPWPGNVRELGNVIERMVLLSDDTLLTRAHIALPASSRLRSSSERLPLTHGPRQWIGAGRDVSAPQTGESSDSELARVLEETGWNITRAAARLRITRNTVRARIARTGLRPPRERAGIRPVEAAVPVEAPQAVTWEPRRLVFVRAQVVAAAEPDSRVGHGLDIARDKLLGFGARIEGLTPSAVLALFGADAAEEPAMLAACAALAVQRAAKLTREEGVGLQLTIGLHTDELLAHAGEERLVVDADASRRAWTALDIALDGAAPDAIVATSSAGALLRRRFDLTRLGTTAYRVERVWSADASARGQRGPLVGRDAELAVLEDRRGAGGTRPRSRHRRRARDRQVAAGRRAPAHGDAAGRPMSGGALPALRGADAVLSVAADPAIRLRHRRFRRRRGHPREAPRDRCRGRARSIPHRRSPRLPAGRGVRPAGDVRPCAHEGAARGASHAPGGVEPTAPARDRGRGPALDRRDVGRVPHRLRGHCARDADHGRRDVPYGS